MKNKRKMSLFGFTTALLITGIVVLANVVSANLFGRIDLTEGKVYSLSPASKDIVAKLEDDFLVKAYFSKNLPSPYNANAKYVQDQLAEYKAFGKGRFRYEFVDFAEHPLPTHVELPWEQLVDSVLQVVFAERGVRADKVIE